MELGQVEIRVVDLTRSFPFVVVGWCLAERIQDDLVPLLFQNNTGDPWTIATVFSSRQIKFLVGLSPVVEPEDNSRCVQV